VILRSVGGKAKEISWLLWVVAAGFLLYFIVPFILQTISG
jgi:xanthine/uracil/vitamin C permease (AzgA family)